MFTVQKYVDKQPNILIRWDGTKLLCSLDPCCPHESAHKYHIRGEVGRIIVIGKERNERWVAPERQMRRFEGRRDGELAVRWIIDFVGLVQFAAPDMAPW